MKDAKPKPPVGRNGSEAVKLASKEKVPSGLPLETVFWRLTRTSPPSFTVCRPHTCIRLGKKVRSSLWVKITGPGDNEFKPATFTDGSARNCACGPRDTGRPIEDGLIPKLPGVLSYP